MCALKRESQHCQILRGIKKTQSKSRKVVCGVQQNKIEKGRSILNHWEMGGEKPLLEGNFLAGIFYSDWKMKKWLVWEAAGLTHL